jgi:phosphatidylglycerophosphatase C
VSNLALFDFDGTLTTHEMLPVFIRGVVAKWRLVVFGPIVMPMVAMSRRGWISVSTLRWVLAQVVFRGMREADYEAAGIAFAREQIPPSLRPEMMERIAWHRGRGDRIVVVSGAYDVYLKHWCAEHGLELIASKLEVRRGRLTGRYAGAQNVAEEKVRRVRELCDLSSHGEIHAYGDTHEDLAMLALATHRTYCGKPMPASA